MISVLPEFTLDIIVRNTPWRVVKNRLRAFKSQIFVKPGGCSTNIAIHLSKLRFRPRLIVFTNKLGRILLNEFLEDFDIDLEIIDMSDLSITVAFEENRGNTMINSPKAIENLKPEDFPGYIIEKLSKEDIIVFTSWNHMRNGNLLIEFISEIKSGKLYLDLGDLGSSLDNKKRLVSLLRKGLVDTLSVNEREVMQLAKLLRIKGNDTVKVAQEIYDRLSLEELYIHTSKFSYALPYDVFAKTEFVERPMILTGAGDAWNAANIFAKVKKYPIEDQLRFANDYARKYILGELL